MDEFDKNTFWFRREVCHGIVIFVLLRLIMDESKDVDDNS